MAALRIETLNTGSELLLGQVINSHPAYFGEELFKLGLRVQRAVAVPDGEPIAVALKEAMGRSDVVLVTGGLGPTMDDVTRETAAELLGLELEFDESVMSMIEERFARMGKTPRPINRRQAMVPKGARVLLNPHGTAPGLHFPAGLLEGSPDIYLLPGPPRELQPMFVEQVLPVLSRRVDAEEEVGWKNLFFYGVGESDLASRVDEVVGPESGIETGYCLKNGGVIVRLIGGGNTLEGSAERAAGTFPANLVSSDGRTMEEVVEDLLREREETVSTAESCTGGFLAHRLTMVSGSSEVFGFGFVTYANEAKSGLVGVDPQLIEKHGAVSGPVAASLAEGAVHASGADHGLSLTGIAGPTGGTEEKPVGTVFLGLASKEDETVVVRRVFRADRETFKIRASQAALDLLRRRLLGLNVGS
ncbi:MAG: competence/damage-inducible protein A [Verrucomicrobiota bacterium]